MSKTDAAYQRHLNAIPRGLVLMLNKMGTYAVDQWRKPGDYGTTWSSIFKENRRRTSLNEADVVSSRARFSHTFHTTDPDEEKHYPIFDLDFPAYLVPSSTAGHHHLYLDKKVSWRDYRRVLKAMNKAGLIEDAYYEATMGARAAFLRLPWLKREDVSRVQ